MAFRFLWIASITLPPSPASDWRIFILVLPAVGADKRLPLRLYSCDRNKSKNIHLTLKLRILHPALIFLQTNWRDVVENGAFVSGDNPVILNNLSTSSFHDEKYVVFPR
ncbi:hypothetical protein MJK71_28510 [Escherichia coli]|nr:hypothetical protein MJK71_28510 [Escherichia coli]